MEEDYDLIHKNTKILQEEKHVKDAPFSCYIQTSPSQILLVSR